MKNSRLPALFLGHGSPMEALESDAYTDAVEKFGRALRRPSAIAVVSAHWAASAPFRVTGAAHPETIHDFYGFPPALHETVYPAPGHPALASDVVRRLRNAGLPAELDPHRGFDHGVWVPLLHLRPAADIPVIQISVPVPSDPAALLKAGETLGPLRDEGVLFVGSGNVTHNLRKAVFGAKDAAPQEWAESFDRWVWERVENGRLDELAAYREKAPHADLAVPDRDHFDPVFFVAGASKGERLSTIYSGFHFGNLSMRSWASGS